MPPQIGPDARPLWNPPGAEGQPQPMPQPVGPAWPQRFGGDPGQPVGGPMPPVWGGHPPMWPGPPGGGGDPRFGGGDPGQGGIDPRLLNLLAMRNMYQMA